jgi:tryptophan-rich sensory protein
MTKPSISLPANLAALFGWLVLTFIFAALGAIASAQAKEFYAQLSQPDWAPPAWLFGPVWTVLYALMAIAVWRVWRQRGPQGATIEITLYIAQLAANALWTWLFFAWNLGLAACVEILLLWLLIVATIVVFGRRDRVAAMLLWPYLAWVSFATVLSFSMWQRNPALLG